MEIKIFWSDTAIKELEKIFDFNKTISGVLFARKTTKIIVKKTTLLKSRPNIGQREQSLLDRENKYRYLVVGNYKVIYWQENHLIKIATVFDCRQNPDKLKNL